MALMTVMTVGELELQASVFATRLQNQIVLVLNVAVNHVFMWTESTSVL